MKSYYDILSVNRDASPDEIKRAYRKLAFIHHPDVGGKTEEFQELQGAYSILKDPVKRAKYDRAGHDNFVRENQEGENVKEEMWRAWFQTNIATDTAVDEFTPGYPSLFMSSEEWIDPHTGDIPWSAEDVRIMKWERVYEIWKKQMEYLKAHRGDLVDSSFAKLLTPDELVRLAFGLKKDRWLSQEEYVETIESADKYAVEREVFMAERERQEGQLQRQESFLDLEEELKNKPFTKEERVRAVQLYHARRDRPGNHLLNEVLLKDNEAVKDRREHEKREGKMRDAKWKDNDNRSQWRREVDKFR